jgi:ribokinase
MTGRVLVFGSLNVDVTFEVRRIPTVGETIVADAVRRAPGGKGANQAHAAARTARGAPVLMAGAVGTDEAGVQLREDLAAVGVDVSLVREVDGVSGTAMIAVDRDGGNVIIVAPGANHEWDGMPDVPVAAGDVVVLQLELPLPVVEHVARAASLAGARVVLNAAPVTPGADRLLPWSEILVVNEIEAAELLALDADALDGDAIRTAARRHAVDLIVTLGEEGAVVVTRQGDLTRLPALPVTAVDTVGAGDAFVGALAASLAAGDELAVAARRGSAAGALTVTAPGARHPDLSSAGIEDLLRRHSLPDSPAEEPS